MARQEFTVDQLRAALNYEPDTGVFVWRTKPNRALKAGDVAGTLDNTGYWRIGFKGKQHIASRLAWFYVFGEWPTHHIDHISGDKSDNRLCNLRDVLRSLNNQNLHRSQKNNLVGVLGVSKHFLRFRAQIRLYGKQIHLGTYSTPELAHAAYLDAKRKHHAGCTI